MTNTKNTKRALLSSVISLVLCFAMLLGTTYAWFTDEVKSGNNIITSGNLDVELEYATVKNGTMSDWKKVAGSTEIFEPNALWEPGRVEVVYLKVSNLGSLALKYQLGVNVVNEDAGTNVYGREFKLSDYLVFKVVEMNDGNLEQYATYEKAVATAGTEMGLKDYNGKSTALAAGEEDYVAMIVYMPETVDNEANHNGEDIPRIDLGVNLYATQQMAEEDSYDETYDEDAWVEGMKVYSAQDLQAAINAGETNITLMEDINLDAPIVIPAVATTYSLRSTPVTLDLNGKTISNEKGYVIENQGNVVITGNGTISGLGGIRANGGSVTIENGNFYCSSKYNEGNFEHTLKAQNATVIINGGNFDTTVNGQNNAMLNASENAVITINGGNFKNVDGVMPNFAPYIFTYEKNGEVIINDGTFYGGWRFNGETATTVINGGDFNLSYDGQSFNANSTHKITIYGGMFNAESKFAINQLENWVAGDFKAIKSENSGYYYVVLSNVDNVVTSATELQGCLDAADVGETLIYLAADINGDVTVSQKEGVNIVIDGQNYKYDGSICVDGNARYTGTEALTVKNVNFATAKDGVDFISASVAKQYAHNVTIENCTFTNNGTGTVVPARLRQAYNITIKDCTVDGTFSVLWATGGNGLTIKNVTANCTTEGISVGTSDNVLVENCNVTVAGENGFGVRADTNVAGVYTMTVNNCTFKAANEVIIRNDVNDYNLIWNGNFGVTTSKLLQYALDKATDGATIILLADITGDVTVTQKPDVKITINGNNKTFAGVITVDGKSATYTTAGLTIQNVNFKADSISADACIRLGDGTNATRYTCNVTVDNCTFDVPGAVGVKSYTGGDKNLVIKNSTITANAHSLVQAKGIDGVLVENCKVYSKNGLNFNNSTNVTVDNCTVDVRGYAVRFGESSGGAGAAETYLIKNCTLKSENDDDDATIILRGTADNATLTIEKTTIEGALKITNTATNATVIVDGANYVTTAEQLQAAIDSGAAKIVLQEGEYVADLYVVPANRNLTITGQGADTKLAFKNLQVRLPLFDSLTISNCTIERMPDKAWGHLVFGSSSVSGGVYTLSNCVFNGEGSQGIYINQDVAATFNIENCTFNGDFGSEGAITVQNNDGADITVNVTGCTFNNIPATSHEIFVHYAYNDWTLNAEGVTAYWKTNP